MREEVNWLEKTWDEVLDEIYQGEKIDVECKKAEAEVPKSVYQSYSSFANTKGGMIVLGIEEDNSKIEPRERFIIIIRGVKDLEKQRNDFWGAINGNKANANNLADENVYDVEKDGIAVLVIADYRMDAGVLKIIKTDDGLKFTNPGNLKLPKEQIYKGGESKARNPHIQTMLRMIGYGDNAGSGFPDILKIWADYGLDEPELSEDTVMNQVTLILKVTAEMAEKTTKKKWRNKSDEKTLEKYDTILSAMQPDRWYKAAEFEVVVGVKESRIKVLLKNMTEQGLIESTGSTKGKMYRKR